MAGSSLSPNSLLVNSRHRRHNAGMEIRRCDTSLAGELADAYNRAVADVPFCEPVTAELVADAMTDGDPLAERDPVLEPLQQWAAIDDGRIIGFIDAGLRPATEKDPQPRGMIRFLCHDPGRRAAGQALLEKVEDALREQGVREIDAFEHHYTYDFYQMHSSYLSDRLAHVAALLGFNDYRRVSGEVFLAWPDFDAPAPQPLDTSFDIVVESKPTPDRRPEVTIKAISGSRQLGVCRTERIADYSDNESIRDWFFVEWLGIERPYQGRGLGKHLLARAFVENASAGYRHAAISTAIDNYRAAAFYTNYGFHLIDWTYGLRKDLREAE